MVRRLVQGGLGWVGGKVSVALTSGAFALAALPLAHAEESVGNEGAATSNSTPAAAADKSNAGEVTSVSQQSTVGLIFDQARKNVSVSYFGAVTGTNLKFQGYSPNPDGSDSGGLGIWNNLGVGYKITQDFQLDAQVVWDWYIAGGHRWVMAPPRIGMSGQVYTSDQWSFWSNLNFELPVTDTATEKHLLTSIGTFNELWFNPTGTGRLQLGAYHSARVSAYTDAANLEEGEEPGNRLEGTITPLIRYRLTPTLDAQLGYALDYSLGQGEGIGALKTGLQQIQPGLNWVVTPRLTVMPYLILQPQGDMDLASTSFGAWITGTIL